MYIGCDEKFSRGEAILFVAHIFPVHIEVECGVDPIKA